MFFILILGKWNLHMYSVTKFHKTPISTNKEGVACFFTNAMECNIYVNNRFMQAFRSG